MPLAWESSPAAQRAKRHYLKPDSSQGMATLAAKRGGDLQAEKEEGYL